ncbi:MAG TPA: SET domain-containing protein [Bacteroidota bacterium]|nr:SET domain-containing protein [Bacteroidota bacterium]
MAKRIPHENVYARIVASKIHGVGVKAIRPIKKGTHIFRGDNTKMIWIKKSEVTDLPREIKKLYNDFCVKKSGWYGCPANFNLMTPAWYLNHSTTPNVAIDRKYDFYALRNIRTDEELTVDYSTYSEVGRRRLRD